MLDPTIVLFIDAIIGAGFENCDPEDVEKAGLAIVTQDTDGQLWCSWDKDVLAVQSLDVLISIYEKQRPGVVSGIKGLGPSSALH